MKMLLATIVLLAAPLGAAAAGSYACNMNALTRSERATHARLSRQLLGRVEEQKELKNGYAFRFPAKSIVDAARWVTLERKCCPFFAFSLELAQDDGPLWMHVTGAEDIKPFIRAEFGLED